jgi:hypothetical protein
LTASPDTQLGKSGLLLVSLYMTGNWSAQPATMAPNQSTASNTCYFQHCDTTLSCALHLPNTLLQSLCYVTRCDQHRRVANVSRRSRGLAAIHACMQPEVPPTMCSPAPPGIKCTHVVCRSKQLLAQNDQPQPSLGTVICPEPSSSHEEVG